jgi:hypothetical protein
MDHLQTDHGKVGPCMGIVATIFSSRMFVTSIPMASVMVSFVSRSVGSTFLRVRAARVTSYPTALPPTRPRTTP